MEPPSDDAPRPPEADGLGETTGTAEPLEAPMDAAAPTVETAPSPTSAASLGGWVRVVGGAVLFALVLRVLGFAAYRIPSTSMEDTLLVGDFVLISKVHYGPRVLGERLPGLDDPDRGDVMVFNYPPSLDPEIGRRTPYIKRVVGLPGDTLSIRGKTPYVGGEAVPTPRRGRRLWAFEGRIPPADSLEALGLGGRVQRAGPGRWVASATERQAERLGFSEGVESLQPYVRPGGDGSAAFPAANRFSLDEYGPVVVPARGATVRLDDASWPVVRTVIERFEGHTVERTATGFLIDGRPAETYTFGQDYYFVLGDSRDDSADSRTWGFVPFDHVIGKAVGVYFSWDDEAGRPRWERIGRGVGE
ncbi:signal peptidase I [Rubrivirga marina]|nr:signal peptidase I [Rubrivirga marina]